jgi:hypothetical protein
VKADARLDKYLGAANRRKKKKEDEPVKSPKAT